MPACTFFGHRECYSLDEQALTDTIEDLIRIGRIPLSIRWMTEKVLSRNVRHFGNWV